MKIWLYFYLYSFLLNLIFYNFFIIFSDMYRIDWFSLILAQTHFHWLTFNILLYMISVLPFEYLFNTEKHCFVAFLFKVAQYLKLSNQIWLLLFVISVIHKCRCSLCSFVRVTKIITANFCFAKWFYISVEMFLLKKMCFFYIKLYFLKKIIWTTIHVIYRMVKSLMDLIKNSIKNNSYIFLFLRNFINFLRKKIYIYNVFIVIKSYQKK